MTALFKSVKAYRLLLFTLSVTHGTIFNIHPVKKKRPSVILYN